MCPAAQSQRRLSPPAFRLPSQRGVALITALLVVALATMLAVSLTRDQALSIRRAENLRDAQQAWEYARGLEQLARNRLHRDLVSGDTQDTGGDPWAQRLGPLPVRGGMLTGRVTDVDGRFNLNGLLAPPPLGELQLRRFRRLLDVLELDPGIAERLLDWMDPDAEARPGGAEDDRYTRQDPPYRAANRPLAHASELRLLAGVDAAAWRRLAPHVSALPAIDTDLNVNTATPEVLRSLADGLGAEAAAGLARAGREGHGSVQSFLAHSALEAFAIPGEGLGVRSNYFLAHGVVELGDGVFHFYSLIRRDGDGLAVLQRSRGEP